MWGGACIFIATYLPWVVVRFDWGWWPRTGMQLTYAHFPPITIGYVALVLGGSAIMLGRAEARRPGYAELAILPAGLTAFLLWFVNSSVHGHFGEQMDAYGALGVSLGPGYWLMLIGTVLVGGAWWSLFPRENSMDRSLLLPSKRSSYPRTRPLATSSARVLAHKQVARSSSST